MEGQAGDRVNGPFRQTLGLDRSKHDQRSHRISMVQFSVDGELVPDGPRGARLGRSATAAYTMACTTAR
jgi:hypothetical protein